jgi:hypothetical protein
MQEKVYSLILRPSCNIFVIQLHIIVPQRIEFYDSMGGTGEIFTGLIKMYLKEEVSVFT